ncbi:hypothetical protein [Acrocarpospora catenulata]|nr:hypothetical protein [Acrocarpospora catenulata]
MYRRPGALNLPNNINQNGGRTIDLFLLAAAGRAIELESSF